VPVLVRTGKHDVLCAAGDTKRTGLREQSSHWTRSQFPPAHLSFGQGFTQPVLWLCHGLENWVIGVEFPEGIFWTAADRDEPYKQWELVITFESFASYVMFFMISLFFVVDILICRIDFALIPVAVRCRACVCGRSRVRIADSSPAGSMDVSLLGMLYCQWEASAMGRSFVQRSVN